MAAKAPSGSEDLGPFVGIDQIVELDEIDRVDAHALERLLELCSRPGPITFLCLGGEEHVAAVTGKEIGEARFGLSVGSCGVDVIDSGNGGDLQCAVGALLAHLPETRGAEDQPAALMTGSSEGCVLHDFTLLRRPLADGMTRQVPVAKVTTSDRFRY